jgi:hypothetical protein
MQSIRTAHAADPRLPFSELKWLILYAFERDWLIARRLSSNAIDWRYTPIITLDAFTIALT